MEILYHMLVGLEKQETKIVFIVYIKSKLCKIRTAKEQWVESYSFSFLLYITQHVHIQLCATLCDPHGLQPTSPVDFPGKNAGVGCHFLVQGIFSTQGWNPCLLHLQLCRGCFPTVPHGEPQRARGLPVRDVNPASPSCIRQRYSP